MDNSSYFDLCLLQRAPDGQRNGANGDVAHDHYLEDIELV
ncbi:hypothetical protein CsSME_00003869 [Camellia sinensis var. sinensis]